MDRKFALIIGNDRYEDPSFAALVSPSSDVRVLAEVLQDPGIGGFDEVIALVNEPEVRVRRGIASLFTRKQPDDLLLLYFSTHGILDENGRLFLAARDTQRDLLKATAISAHFITDEMDNSASRRQALILDCCHSGAFARGTKGSPGSSVSTASAFEGNGFGRVVLTATDSTQYAWDGEKVVSGANAPTSVFTRHLIEGLRTGAADEDDDGQISLDELYEYVYRRVLSETPRQTPGKWSYKQQGNLIIARNPHPGRRADNLPPHLQQALESDFPATREAAVRELGRSLRGSQVGLARAAEKALERISVEDDSRKVQQLAAALLMEFRGPRKERPVEAPVQPAAAPAPRTFVPSSGRSESAEPIPPAKAAVGVKAAGKAAVSFGGNDVRRKSLGQRNWPFILAGLVVLVLLLIIFFPRKKEETMEEEPAATSETMSTDLGGTTDSAATGAQEPIGTDLTPAAAAAPRNDPGL